MTAKLLQETYPEKEISEGAYVYSGYAFKSKDLDSFGIPVVKIEADSGAIGGKGSQEFIFLNESLYNFRVHTQPRIFDNHATVYPITYPPPPAARPPPMSAL